jgi:hypothetical protein
MKEEKKGREEKREEGGESRRVTDNAFPPFIFLSLNTSLI